MVVCRKLKLYLSYDLPVNSVWAQRKIAKPNEPNKWARRSAKNVLIQFALVELQYDFMAHLEIFANLHYLNREEFGDFI